MNVERSGTPGRAVFLSYASQDAEAAKRIADALRAAGVEVWFDQNELVGGDAWDAKIRKQIKECALLIPIISANTQARREGYFRLEWRLAVERMRQMDDDLPFLLPVVIDDTSDAGAFVPEKFREVQWTRLKGGETVPAFVGRVQKLLGASVVGASLDDARGRAQGAPLRRSRPRWLGPVILGTVVIAVAAVWLARKPAPDPKSPDHKSQTPAQTEARDLLAKAWEQLNRTELYRTELEIADGLLKRAAELAQDDPDVWAAWAHVDAWYVYHNLDPSPERREGARQKAARALRLDAQSFEARLADACYIVRATGAQPGTGRAGDSLPAAERTLRDLVQERPDDHRPRFALGILLRNARRFDEGVAEFERMALLPGHAATAWSEKGWLLQFAADSRGAVEAADRSIAVQPFFGNLLLRLQLARYWTGDLEVAKAAAAQLPASVRIEEVVVASAVELFRWRREPAEMLRILEAVPRAWIASQGFNGPKFFLVAEAHRMAGREDAAQLGWREALRLIEQRLEKEADSAPLLTLKARTLWALGRQPEARQTARLAESFGAANNLDLLLELGEHDRALVALQQLMEAPMSELSGATRWAELKLNPRFDPLRSDPRFQGLLAQAGADPRRNPHATTERESSGPGPAAEKSVAVLAFENRSSEKNSEYFSDGVSDELINVLGRVAGLKVVARTSSFAFKGNKTISAREIARTLGVTHLVEGSVQQAGGKARVIARLIQADTGEQLWGDSFDADVKDILAAQVTTARAIAKAMALRLDSGNRMESLNSEAVQLYLQGRQEWGKRTDVAMRRAEDLFKRAIALEPKFARAHAGLVDVWATLGQQDDSVGLWGERDSNEMSRIVERARLAVALDPNSAEAHTSLGGALVEAWQPAEAKRAFEQALELNSNYATAHQWLGRVLLRDGLASAAVTHLRRACELDPLSSRMADNHGISLWFIGRSREGLAELDRALVLQPNAEQAMAQRAMVLATLGRSEEAITLAREVLQHSGPRKMHAVYALAVAGRKDEAARASDSVPKARALSRRAPALAALGRWDECLMALQPETMLPATAEFMLFESVFDPIRNDPRFVAALETLGLREAHERAQAWRAANPPQKTPMKQ